MGSRGQTCAQGIQINRCHSHRNSRFIRVRRNVRQCGDHRDRLCTFAFLDSRVAQFAKFKRLGNGCVSLFVHPCWSIGSGPHNEMIVLAKSSVAAARIHPFLCLCMDREQRPSPWRSTATESRRCERWAVRHLSSEFAGEGIRPDSAPYPAW